MEPAVTIAVTMRASTPALNFTAPRSMSKFLIELDCFQFEESSWRIRFDFAQKHRFIANDSFSPIC